MPVYAWVADLPSLFQKPEHCLGMSSLENALSCISPPVGLRREAYKGNTTAVKLFLDLAVPHAYPVNLHGKDWNGWTLLHEACSEGHTSIIELLLARGADIESRNTAGFTCLHLATYNAHIASIETLLAAGATQHARDLDGADVMYTARKQFLVAKTDTLEHRNKKIRFQKILDILRADLDGSADGKKFLNTPWSQHERVVT